jgi:GntR family transcriptional regulator/MocR family aminotransferase
MKTADQSRQKFVFDRIRDGILSGTLAAGTKLPPTRDYARELGVGRQTVVIAYEQLASEGYVSARAGAGTFVAAERPDATPPHRMLPEAAPVKLSARGDLLAALMISAAGPVADGSGLMAPGVPAAEFFPAKDWARAAAKVLRELPPERTGYPDVQGYAPLRAAIAAHLAATRGLIANPEQIVVTAGTQQALLVAAQLLLDPGDPVWVEDPGYIAGRGALLAAGAALVPVPSDREGIDVAEGVRLAPRARLALVAPSHATPLGGALPVTRRLALLDWAARAESWILEDDCDSEFRWAGKPLPPLATLDRHGRVIYCGTFSKTLAPALRLGFAVVPAPLVGPFVRARALMDRGPGTLTQAVLAEFLASGRLAPHIRRMRTEYGRRRTALFTAFEKHTDGLFTPLLAPGGLHFVVSLGDNADEAAVVQAARARGLAVSPLAAYYNGTARLRGLVIGFATVPVAMAGEAARRLAAAVKAGWAAG